MIYRLLNKLIITYLHYIKRLCHIRGTVLMMHSIGGEDEGYNISIEDFNTLVSHIKRKKCINARSVLDDTFDYCLTFDDVRESFFLNAYPILKRNAIPFTCFIATNLLDQKGYLSTEQLLTLNDDPLCEIGSHSVNHEKFVSFKKLKFINELEQSHKRLQELTQKEVNTFAFPYGSYTACGFRHKSYVLDFYKLGFSTMPIPMTAPSLLPKYFLPRINVDKNYISQL